MNNFARAHNSWLNPPDEPEAVFCEECGEEMTDGETCKYQFCPSKFEGDAKEMAYMLLGATEEVKSLAQKIKQLERRS